MFRTFLLAIICALLQLVSGIVYSHPQAIYSGQTYCNSVPRIDQNKGNCVQILCNILCLNYFWKAQVCTNLYFVLKITYMVTIWNFESMPNKFNALEICTSGSCVQKWVTKLYNYYPIIFFSSVHKLKNFKVCVSLIISRTACSYLCI